MLGNPSVIPTVQVGAGVPLQSTMVQSVQPQASILPGQASSIAQPVTAGSMLGVPPGTLVPVQVGNSIVQVPTQPVQTQSVLHMSMQPVYQTQTIQVPVETQVAVPEPVEIVPQTQPQIPTPTVKTLPPKIIRNELPPKHNQVMLPAKVVQTRLPPIGPPPTPELNLQVPPPAPVETIQSVVVPQTTSIQYIEQPVTQTVAVPVVQVPVQSVIAQPVMVPNYQTMSVPQQVAAPVHTGTSVIAQY